MSNVKTKLSCTDDKKLSNVSENCKAYWSLLTRLLNNKKIPLIPPLFHENKFLTDFKEKAELFNCNTVLFNK